jgi:uncharacterized delta-60 repeat protein
MARTRQSVRLSMEDLEARAVPAAGALDPSFAINGQQSLSAPQPGVASPIDAANSSVVQSDGKIVVAGYVGPSIFGPNAYLSGSPSPDFGVTRLNPNGSVDTTFGVNGLARIPFDIGALDQADLGFTVGLQSDGRIVIAGAAAVGTGTWNQDPLQWAVGRLNTDGSLDTTFGTNGKVTFDFGGVQNNTYPSDMVITADDQITLIGTQDKTNTSSFEVVRLLPRGTFSSQFGNAGEVTVTNPTAINGLASSGYTGGAGRIAVNPDGSLILAGPIANRAGDYVVAKISSTGALDTTFGSLVPVVGPPTHTGFAYANLNPIDPTTGFPGVFNGFIGDVAVDATGDILATGAGNGNFTTVRFTPSGTRDSTFATNGISTVAFDLGGANFDAAYAIGIQPNGKIVLGGQAQVTGSGVNNTIFPTSPLYHFAATRLTSTGALDTTFGTGGKVHYSVNNPAGDGNLVAASSMNFTTGGKILLVGSDSARIDVLQLLNDVSFNPLPPPPAPPSGNLPPIQSPGTKVSQIAAGAEGPALAFYQPPTGQNFLYNPAQESNLAAQGPMQFLIAGFTGVVRTSVGDVDGDGKPDIAVITGAGTATRWAVLSGIDPNAFVIAPRPAFPGSEDFTGGGYVSLGDLNGDGKDEIVISADQGGGPRIEVYQFTTSTTAPSLQANFFGIADPNFRGGARTAVGDINGDGVPDLAVAAGFGGAPRVALYDGYFVLTTQAKLANDFNAFDATLRDGAYLAIGDVNGDGYGDLVFGSGDGGAPRVLVVNGQKLLTGTAGALSAPISSFFMAGDSTSRGGVRVAVKNVDGDNKADIVTGSGEGQFSRIRVYKGASEGKGEPTSFQDLNPFNTVLADGVYVG